MKLVINNQKHKILSVIRDNSWTYKINWDEKQAEVMVEV